MASFRRAAGIVVVALSAGQASADEAPPVGHVGEAVLTAAAVQRRLAAMPEYQLRALGGPEAARRQVVDTALVPELLYAEEAKRRGLEKEPRLGYRLDDVLRRVLVDALRAEVEAAGVPEEKVRAYYEAHVAEYRKPERLRLQRIIVDDEALARRIITECQGKDGPERWSRLAREHSLDLATKMRGGMLGFVHPDGHTDAPQVAVDAALYTAAHAVKDGEFVPAPVREGARFSVVWRRGTLAKVERSLPDERDHIREILIREGLERRIAELVAELRKRDVRDVDIAPLEHFAPDPAPSAANRPPDPSPARSVDPAPKQGPSGLR